MHLLVRCPEKPQEFVLLELQGVVESGASLDGQDLGNITIKGPPDGANTQLSLTIGAHLLDGKIVKLKNPLCIIRKKDSTANTSTLDATQIENLSLEYQVVGVIRKKYLFKTRPKPVTMS